MDNQLKEDLQLIINEDLATAVIAGAAGAIGGAVGLYLRKRKTINDYCEKKNIPDKQKCKAKFHISELRKLLQIVKKGRADCRNQKDPQKCVARFNKFEENFNSKLKTWQQKL
jgi:hypothetical protein